jgi:hypothetical protein
MTTTTEPRTVENLFERLEIAISISDSLDLEALGFGDVHLVEAMLEFARHVMKRAGTVAYGGDLRPGGFTEQLFELTAQLAASREGVVHSYLAWPIHLGLVQARVDDLSPAVRFERLPEATGTVDPRMFPIGPGAPLLWARNLTAMRQAMTTRTAARIVLGGRITGALGAMPGVVEEALLAIERGQPLFVLGGFGGCAKVIWNAITDEPTPELELDYQDAHGSGYRQLVADYNTWAVASGERVVDYPAIRRRFADAGPGRLGNGLTAEDNARLAETPYVPEMIALVLQGCRRVFAT